MEIYVLVAFIAIIALFLSYKIYLTDKEVDSVKARTNSHAARLDKLEHLVDRIHQEHEDELCVVCERYDDRLADIDAVIGDTTKAADAADLERTQELIKTILNSWNVSVPYLMDFMKIFAEKRKDVREIWEQAEKARGVGANTEVAEDTNNE